MNLLRICGRVALALVLLFVAYQLWLFAHVWWWRSHNPDDTAFMDAQRELHPDAELRHRWVAYARISPNLKRAVIAAEDARFLEHEGFDWEGIEAAWEKNRKSGRIKAGGSTISQQLAKNLFLSGRRSYVRKLEEAAITVMLEHCMDKRRIFEIYLNVIEWGNGVFGAEAAARHYFGVNADALTPIEAARLAAIVPNPRYYDAHRNNRALARKTAIIARRIDFADAP